LKFDETNKTQRQIYDVLHASGIGANLHYIPVYRQPFYERIGFLAGYCPHAERYYSDAISIPLYPGLTEDQQAFVVQTLRIAFAE
jgi:dTDP-4-amino-4,6-dideoxygalactose transaminase